MKFSTFDRASILQQLAQQSYDLLIIGGGITGVGIALDAASRGLRVALVEKNDFAYGTSSRSTKLIHGGLRYLKQLEFALVKEVGSERAIVHRIAPHLVIAEKMLLPLSEGRGLGTFLTSFGLMLYDWLAGVKPADQRRMLTRRKTLRIEPLLRKEGIKGGGLYAEYRTDDARLTIEIAKSASKQGADLINYVRVNDFIYTGGKVVGVKVEDVHARKNFTIHATAIVNATGPWVDTLREIDKSKKEKTLHLTKGVHIVVERRKLPIQQAIYFDVTDGRMIFAIPRGRTTYIGTTDTEYAKDIDAVCVEKNDVEYLLKAVNEAFPTISLSLRDVESSWAGLRPLIHEEGKSASELSRKDEIFESPSGLLSVAGGKLTGYRKMAERVVNLAIKRSFKGATLRPCHTATIKVCGAEFKNYKEVRRYLLQIKKQLSAYGLPYLTAAYLVHTYGKQTDTILARLALHEVTGIDNDEALLKAELWFTIHYEMVISPLDFLVRRTGLLFFDMPRLIQHKAAIMDEFKKYFQWSDESFQTELQKLTTELEQATLFR